MKKAICLLLGLLIFNAFAESQTEDAGAIANIAVSANYGRSWGFKLEQELRFNQNFSTYDRSATSIKTTLDIFRKLMKLEGEYVFIHQNIVKNYEIRHRGSFGLSTMMNVDPLTISLTTRIQSTWRDESNGDYKFNPKYVLRNKLNCAYKIFGSPIKPYISGEMFCPVNTPYGAFVDGIRITLGGEYRINRRQSVELFYRIDKEIQKANPLTMFYAGFGWQYRL